MQNNEKKRIGQLLDQSGVISKDELERSLQEQKSSQKRLGELLIDKGFCTEEDIALALSQQLALDQIDLHTATFDPAALETIPESLARKHKLIPISLDGRYIRIAMADPSNIDAIQDVQFATGLRINPCIATSADILWSIEKQYNMGESVDQIVKDISSTTSLEILDEDDTHTDLDDLRKRSEAAPIIRMVNHILGAAVEQRASDIHIEPAKEKLAIRFRVDGHLRKNTDLPKWVQGAVISRIKLMAHMDIAEKRIPQDGRLAIRVSGRKLDMRVSTLPSNHGEKIVARILDRDMAPLSVHDLGMSEKDRISFMSLISKPQGILLVTGPTGSGKTTSLYAALSEINSVERNITTVEDPVEYELDGICQVGVNEKAGRTFSTVLPAFLRQDPDVIMVGEMRDLDTASIAMRAALTGHLVLSTLHTNSTIEAITRLRNLGIPSSLIAYTINGIVAQRLVRLVCSECRIEDKPEPEKLKRLGISEEQVKQVRFYKGEGCSSCGGTGYKGRGSIYEILVMSHRIRESISNESTEGTMRQLALAEGLQTLPRAAIDKLFQGETTVDELLRVIQIADNFGSLCPDCNTITNPEFNACTNCGKKLIETCPTCRQASDSEWTYCPFCTSLLSGADSDGEEPTPKTPAATGTIPNRECSPVR